MKKTMAFMLVALLVLTQAHQTYTLTHDAQKALTIAAAVVGALGGGYACYQDFVESKKTDKHATLEKESFQDKALTMLKVVAGACATSALFGGIVYFTTSFHTPEAHLRYAQKIINAEQQNPLANQAFPSSDAIHKEIKNTYNNDKTYLVRAYDYLTRSWHRLTQAANSLATAHADTTDAALRTAVNPLTATAQAFKDNIHTNQGLIAELPLFTTQSNTQAIREQTETLAAAIHNQPKTIIYVPEKTPLFQMHWPFNVTTNHGWVRYY